MRSVVLLPQYHGRMTQTSYLTRQEAALRLGITVADVDRLIRHGVLDRYRLRERYVRVLTGQVAELATLPREWLLRC